MRDALENFLLSIFSSEWRVLLIIGVLLLVFAEVGYRVGVRLHARKDEARRGQVGGVHGAILGILGLLLGFTYSMAVGRYDTRKEMVLTEANAIGTTYLRADFLPAAHRDAVKKLLREFVDVRLALNPGRADTAGMAEQMRKSAELETALWEHAKAVAEEVPTPITATFVVSLNEMIDTDAMRIAALRNRIPGGVWLLLLLVAAFGCFTSGYGSGAYGVRSLFPNVILPVLITLVIVLIYDIMHLDAGVVGISQKPLLELKASMTVPEPKPPGP